MAEKTDGDSNWPARVAAFEQVVKALAELTADERVRVLHAAAIIFEVETALREKLALGPVQQ